MTDDILARVLARRGWPGRPLVEERPAVDLLNTRWLTSTERFDVLADDELTAAWLADRGLGALLPGARVPLVRTRDALAAVIHDRAASAPLNDVLDRGRLRLRWSGEGAVESADVTDPAWHAAWACARDYVDLVTRMPGRIRNCANPPCVLHFVDHSRKGDRRWCSMAVCGNRSKARRHRERLA